jgi:TolB protein
LRGPGIAVIRADGRGARLLTHDKDDLSPAWSPAGTRLVFTRRGDLYVIRADGTHFRRLTRGAVMDYDPAWSPGGGWIAFTRNVDDEDGVWIARTDGTGFTRKVTEDGADPSWAPNGKRIVASSVSQGLIVLDLSGTGRVLVPIGGSQPAWQSVSP